MEKNYFQTIVFPLSFEVVVLNFKSFFIIFVGELFNEREYSSWTLKLKSYFNYLNDYGISHVYQGFGQA